MLNKLAENNVLMKLGIIPMLIKLELSPVMLRDCYSLMKGTRSKNANYAKYMIQIRPGVNVQKGTLRRRCTCNIVCVTGAQHNLIGHTLKVVHSPCVSFQHDSLYKNMIHLNMIHEWCHVWHMPVEKEIYSVHNPNAQNKHKANNWKKEVAARIQSIIEH